MRRAFSITDLSASLVVVAVLLAIAAAGLSETRRHAQLGEDIASLKRFGAATPSFAADHEDRLWGFSWKGGETQLMMNLDGELVETVLPLDDLGAGAYQAVHLIRSIGGRIGPNGMPIVSSWIPHVYYSHLPLMEYLNEDPLVRWTTSVADEVRQNWKDEPEDKFDNGLWLPLQPDPSPNNIRWPYSAGYQLVPAGWDINQSEFGNQFDGQRVQQGGAHNTFNTPSGAQFGGRPLSDVVYPSGKAQMFDTHQRHFGSQVHYFAVVENFDQAQALARVPILMFDGSASVRASADSNPGWRPNTTTFPCMTFDYSPSAWEPATTNGEAEQFSVGVYRWTRGGLKGLDFGGMPLDTNQAVPGECDF